MVDFRKVFKFDNILEIMTISVPVSAKNLSADQLVEIYHQFCIAYDFIYNPTDERYLKNQGIRLIRSGSTLEYSPCVNAKFFGEGHDKHTDFWGYTSNTSQLREARRFNMLVAKLFSKGLSDKRT
jgi:hypothetical protein